MKILTIYNITNTSKYKVILNIMLNTILNTKEVLNINELSHDAKECIYCKNVFDKNTGGMYVTQFSYDRPTLGYIGVGGRPLIVHHLYKCKNCINNKNLTYINDTDGKRHTFIYPDEYWKDY